MKGVLEVGVQLLLYHLPFVDLLPLVRLGLLVVLLYLPVQLQKLLWVLPLPFLSQKRNYFLPLHLLLTHVPQSRDVEVVLVPMLQNVRVLNYGELVVEDSGYVRP